MVIKFNVFPVLFFLVPFFQPLRVVVAVIFVVSCRSNSLCGYTVRLKWKRAWKFCQFTRYLVFSAVHISSLVAFAASLFLPLRFCPKKSGRYLHVHHNVFKTKDTEKAEGREQGRSTNATGSGIYNPSQHGPSSSTSPYRWFCFTSLPT